MRKSLFKKISAAVLSLSLVVGMTAIVPAVNKGTDVSSSAAWTSYSIHTREDKGEWEDKLKKAGQVWDLNVTKDSKVDSHKTYGESAKITTKTASGFTMDVASTGWSGQSWNPVTGKCVQSNPWGVTADKVVKVERGRYYTINFKIKSTLSNELTKEEKRADGTYYNVGIGQYNYIKHIHFKAFDNTDKDGASLQLSSLSAKIGGKSVLVKGDKVKNVDFDSFVTLDSKNTADDGWVTVSAKVLIPSDKADYQSKAKTPTMGIKFAFGAFMKEYTDEVGMKGTIQVKDFTVKADDFAAKPKTTKVKKATKKKADKKISITLKKVSGAKYQVAIYKTKSNAKKNKSALVKKNIKSTKATISSSKLKNKKELYVTARAFKTVQGSKICGKWTSPKKAKIK